tara:strand:- start:211 stop:477 length:267 start_codon:yes stop_codon:yes gene_type:complete
MLRTTSAFSALNLPLAGVFEQRKRIKPMGWFVFVDGYCERLDAELFAEPVNLISNGGFLVVAYWLWPRAQPGSGARTLVILLAAIGLG